MNLTMNGTIEEITLICSRIAEPSINEIVEEEKLETIVNSVINGETLENAKLHWQEAVNKKTEAVIADVDDTKVITKKEIKEMSTSTPEVEVKTNVVDISHGSEDGGLHLEGAPPQGRPVKEADTATNLTKDDVALAAGKLAKAGQMSKLKDILQKFGVKKILDLKESDYEEAYQLLTGAQNG